MPIGFVLTHYNEGFVAPTLRKLTVVAANLHPDHIVFVANHESAYRQLSAASSGTIEWPSELLLHDNSGMEFGAYQVGVDRLAQLMDPDWIIIGNDTFATHGNFSRVYTERLVAEMQRFRDFPTVIGRTHDLPRSYRLQGLRTHRWVQTSLFAINRAALHALGGRIYRPELESLVNGSADMSTFFSDAIDPVLRRHLEVWLFRTHPGPQWYASESLHADNAARMARKARSILQEKFLAAVLDDAGAEFVNLNELGLAKKVLRKFEDKIFEVTRSTSGSR